MCEEAFRVRVLAALGHCVEVLDDIKPCGHSGDEETGEHDADCMLCRVEAALAHAEEVSAKGMFCPDCDGVGRIDERKDDIYCCPEHECETCRGTGNVTDLRDAVWGEDAPRDHT